MNKEKRWESIAKRKEQEVVLFERKFVEYRNKMVQTVSFLEREGHLPELQQDLKRFLEEEQGDVEFLS